MRFEWNQQKHDANLAKHKISFETAATIFEDENLVLQQDRDDAGEMRWHAIGAASNFLLLLVVHTSRDDEGEEVIRIISARRASAQEWNIYEETNGL